MIGDVQSQPHPSRPPWDRERANGELATLSLLAFDCAEAGALMGEAVELICGVLGVEFGSVMQASTDRGELVLTAGYGWADGEVGERTISTGIDSSLEYVSMAAYAMSSKEPVRVEDLTQDPRFGGCPLMRDHGIVSGVMAKIYVRNRLFGLLGAYSSRRMAFTKDEAYWLADVAKVLGGTLMLAQAQEVRQGKTEQEQARAWRRERDALQDAMEVVAASSCPRAALVAAAKMAVAEFADWCFVDLVEHDGDGFQEGDTIRRIVVGADWEGAEDESTLAEELSYPLNPTASHGTPKVVRSGRPELIPFVTDEVLLESANDPEHLASLRKLDPKSYVAVPVRVAGRPVGALMLFSIDPERLFGERELQRAEDLARCASLVLSGLRWRAKGTVSGAVTVPITALLAEERAPVVRAEHRPALGEGRPRRRDGTSSASPLHLLQGRQMEVLMLLNQGKVPAQIAAKLHLQPTTVYNHLQKIYRALGVTGQGPALFEARRLGLFDD
jgi:GAF domain-containing protein/DNA-binding CsgD family transcriptional regulator